MMNPEAVRRSRAQRAPSCRPGGRSQRRRSCSAEPAHRTSPLRVVVIAVDGEDGQADVHVLVLVVDGRPPVQESSVSPCSVRGERETHVASRLIPKPASLMTSRLTGRGPMVNSRRAAIVWYSAVREGRFSWNRSPASRSMSTCTRAEMNQLQLARDAELREQLPNASLLSASPSLTSFAMASCRISRKVLIESLPRTGSVSA